MVQVRSCLPAAALAGLLTAAGGPAVHAMFDESTKGIICDDPGLKPVCLASLGDYDLFTIDRAAECKTCTSARAKARCQHQQASLVNLHYQVGQGRWSRSRLSRPLAPTSAWLGWGGGNTLLLADGEELSRLHLVREGASWKVVRAETVISWLWLGMMTGEGTVFPTFAVTPDRSVVVGLGRSVVLLPPDLIRSGPGAAKWLLGKPPAPADPKAAAGDSGPGMLVAVDGLGRVLVLDRKTRGVLAIDPVTGSMSRVLRGEQWPLREFVPVDLAAAGRQLFVYGHASASPLARAVLIGLDPGGKDQPCVISPAIETIKGAPFTFTPLGHMALADCFCGKIWFFPNPTVRPAARGESADPSAARAAADAAYSALLEEVAAESAKARPAPRPAAKVETKVETKLETKVEAAGPEDSGFRRYPPDPANQRKIARMAEALAAPPRLGLAFNDWTARQRSRHPVRAAGLAEQVVAADRSVPLAVPAAPPAGLARFTLREAALRRVVKWMLLNADRANRPEEVAQWSARGGQPLFSFGLYENNRSPQVILELADLRPVAGRIDELGGDPGTSVAGQLDAVDGIVGIRTPKDGPARFSYGLTLVLGEGNRSIAAIHPGGTWAVEHRWAEPAATAAPGPDPGPPSAAAPAPVATPAAAEAAQAQPPAARPRSRLNPRAAPFVMPGS